MPSSALAPGGHLSQHLLVSLRTEGVAVQPRRTEAGQGKRWAPRIVEA
jgi:hypothetical protein